MKLDDPWKEPDFGLRVALNAIPKDRLVEIKAEQVFAKFHLANERAPKASPISSFGVEFDRDLVGAVEGEPKRQPSLGKIIRGGTSLRLHLPISSLAQALDDSAALFASEQYKSDWPEIGNMRPVSDDLLIQELEACLDKDIVNGLAGNRISLFTPTQRREDSLYAIHMSMGDGRRSQAQRHTCRIRAGSIS